MQMWGMLGGLGITLTFSFKDVFQICIYLWENIILCFFLWFYKIISKNKKIILIYF
jgi:hypothetical protein